MNPKSYRLSHVGDGIGQRYEQCLAKKIDAAIWEQLTRPHLKMLLAQESAAGRQHYLDFACGTGRILEASAVHFENVSAIDISPDMLQIARERFKGAQFHCVDVTQQPNAVDDTFDCVTAFRFFANAEPTLRSQVAEWLSDHMAPGGALIGNTHCHPWSMTGALNTVSSQLLRRLRRTLSRDGIEKLLQPYGFTVERWDGFRILPTVVGRPPLGTQLQIQAEKMAMRASLGFFGADQIFVARRR